MHDSDRVDEFARARAELHAPDALDAPAAAAGAMLVTRVSKMAGVFPSPSSVLRLHAATRKICVFFFAHAPVAWPGIHRVFLRVRRSVAMFALSGGLGLREAGRTARCHPTLPHAGVTAKAPEKLGHAFSLGQR